MKVACGTRERCCRVVFVVVIVVATVAIVVVLILAVEETMPTTAGQSWGRNLRAVLIEVNEVGTALRTVGRLICEVH